MKEKIIFVFLFLLIISNNGLSKNQNENDTIQKKVSALANKFGDTFFEAIYSIDNLRPYSIIQIDKIAKTYNNSWISPAAFVTMLNKKDKKILTNKISEFIADFEQKQQNETLNKINSWCIAENLLNIISGKIGIGRTNVLNIIITLLPAPVNTNTGEIISAEKADNNEEFYYYSTLNQLSNLPLKEQYGLFSKLFGELAQR
jgi:translation elongation factor EF-G